MTEQSPSGIGTVAQEAARLIEDMATMARASYSGGADAPQEAGQPAPGAQGRAAPGPQGHHGAAGQPGADQPSEGTCSVCGAQSGQESRHDGFSTCKICPLCRGIALLRSVRPETVDMLADLALSVAGSLRDVAMWSRASEPAGSARPGPSGAPEPGRPPVQDIPVDDDSEGSRW
jgi:hypothetical protein